MSILTATNIGQSFGAFDVFRGINVSIPNDGKIGLVGPKGIGKTTLLLILAGIAQPSAGSVHIARGRRLGYLRQETIEAFAQRENTVYGEMLTVFAGLRDQQRRLHEMEEAIANGDETLLDAYGPLQEGFAQAGGYDYDVRIQRTLDGLGFGKEQGTGPRAHHAQPAPARRTGYARGLFGRGHPQPEQRAATVRDLRLPADQQQHDVSQAALNCVYRIAYSVLRVGGFTEYALRNTPSMRPYGSSLRRI